MSDALNKFKDVASQIIEDRLNLQHCAQDILFICERITKVYTDSDGHVEVSSYDAHRIQHLSDEASMLCNSLKKMVDEINEAIKK